MEDTTLKTPPKIPIEAQSTEPECKTPTPIPQPPQNDDPNSTDELRKSLIPDPLRVPKAFKFPERYTSPTDSIMSPVTKGLLARGKKGVAKLPPGKYHPKIPDMSLQEVGPFQNNKVPIPMLIDERINSI
ncbi:uncharacterized protein LOC130739440 [Lotus japonicus]|uniref:Uncharacterized protein n=1 Tax=Lotus japonicus TaxID=34305 RepID=I3SJ15_LOTJA|nr:uncharacterized protein LOC130739440 [Lotus japonicus]AFK40257.1 unknown [Lotus japonicus]